MYVDVVYMWCTGDVEVVYMWCSVMYTLLLLNYLLQVYCKTIRSTDYMYITKDIQVQIAVLTTGAAHQV